jgi:hypothetical protein
MSCTASEMLRYALECVELEFPEVGVPALGLSLPGVEALKHSPKQGLVSR